MRFNAPWSTTVKAITLLVTVALAAITLFMRLPETSPQLLWHVIRSGPLLIVAGSALYTVRGYRLEQNRLLVERLFWATPVDLDGLERVWVDPEAMKHSIRLFGNGGLYSITGRFKNKTLGHYRAWATHPKKAVVLQSDGKRIVVTPGDPEGFLRQLQLERPELAIGPES